MLADIKAADDAKTKGGRRLAAVRDEAAVEALMKTKFLAVGGVKGTFDACKVIESTSGVTFNNNANIIIGTTLLAHADINTATNNGGAKSFVIETAAGVTFSDSADIFIGTVTGTLKTELTGATTNVVIETASAVSFVTTADLIIGSTKVAFANVNTATNTGTTSVIILAPGLPTASIVSNPSSVLPSNVSAPRIVAVTVTVSVTAWFNI